ncbi:hypothetical protein H0H81_012560, partial [Sphagnurus paluster]
MGNKKAKCKASSPAESVCPAPSHPVSPVYQAASCCDTPNQGYLDYQRAQEAMGYDSSEELEYLQEEQQAPSTPETINAILTSLETLLGDKTANHLTLPKLASFSIKKMMAILPNTLEDAAKRPSPHHIVGAINRELRAWARELIGGVQVANLGDSHILAATWMVGCNLLLTASKVCDDRGLATPTYSTIVGNVLFPIPAFSNTGVTVIPYRLAARLQIKGLPTWDPSTNKPVELTSIFNTLDGLSIFENVELIKNGPVPSDALSWARDPKTFNAESCPCTVT